jgi:hypothetical protein
MASKNSVRKPLKLPKNKSKNCKSMEIDIFPIPHRKDGMARNVHELTRFTSLLSPCAKGFTSLLSPCAKARRDRLKKKNPWMDDKTLDAAAAMSFNYGDTGIQNYIKSKKRIPKVSHQ